jgi:hypothetical protein
VLLPRAGGGWSYNTRTRSKHALCLLGYFIAPSKSVHNELLAGTLNDPFGISILPLDENDNALLVNQLRVGVLGLFAVWCGSVDFSADSGQTVLAAAATQRTQRRPLWAVLPGFNSHL